MPHPSVAVHVLDLVQVHPCVFTGAPSVPPVMVGVPPQLSVATGVPAGNSVGLQPRLALAGHVVNTGGVTSIALNI